MSKNRILSQSRTHRAPYHVCTWHGRGYFRSAPKKIENMGFYRQKLNYIHENPVRKAYVALVLVVCESGNGGHR